MGSNDNNTDRQNQMADYTTQGGTDWELKEAENALIAAGDDPQARALAQRRHAEAIRNMMQSALVPSFEKAVSTLIDKSAASVIAEVHISIEAMTGLVQQILAATKEHGLGLKKHAKEIKDLQGIQVAHAARLDSLDNIEEWRVGVDTRISAIEQADRDDIRAEIKDIKAALIRYEQKHQELIERLGQRAAEAVADDGH